jgi:hypothetical protein
MSDLYALESDEDDLVLDDDTTDLELVDPKEIARREMCAREPWRCPAKPKVSRVLQDTERIKEEHSYRLLVNALMRQWLMGERFGHYPRDKELIDKQEFLPAPLDDLKNEHFKMCAWHARMNIQVKSHGRAVIGDEEREAVEDFSRLLLREWATEYAVFNQGGDFLWGLADSMGAAGMLVAYIHPDPNNTRTGTCFQMIDPNGCFPVYEGKRGLKTVYLASMATAEEVIGWYGDSRGSVERKVRKLVRYGRDDGEYDPLCEKELVCCYDRRWTTVLWGGDLIRQVEHGMGEVPFEVQGSGVGMQGFMQSPDPQVTGADADTLTMGADTWRAHSRQLDTARRHQPLLWRRVPSHALMEAQNVRLDAMFRRASWKPSLIIGQTNQSVIDGEPERAPGEDGVTLVRAEDVVNPYPNMAVDPGLLTMLTAWQQRNTQTGMPAGMTNPNPGGAQASGNAIDMLNADGYEGWTPVTLGIQHFLGRCIARVLRDALKHGDAYGGDEYPGGLLVPRNRPGLFGMADPHELTPELLGRAGTDVDVKLHKFNAASLPPLVQSVMMAKQAGIMSQQIAVELIGAAQDIEDELRRIDEDQLAAVPELMAAKALKLTRNRAMTALRMGDVESAREQLLEGQYLADQLTVAQAARLSMVNQAVMEAMGSGVDPAQLGGGGMMQPDPMALGPGGGGGQAPGMAGANAGTQMSPSQFGGSTGQQSPGRPQTQGQGQMGGLS